MSLTTGCQWDMPLQVIVGSQLGWPRTIFLASAVLSHEDSFADLLKCLPCPQHPCVLLPGRVQVASCCYLRPRGIPLQGLRGYWGNTPDGNNYRADTRLLQASVKLGPCRFQTLLIQKLMLITFFLGG